jgi:hypothetical protein
MHDEATLQNKAVNAIASGRIPDRAPERCWGGPGTGACCAICCTTVQPEETEFEIQFAPTDHDPEPRSYHAHVRCFAAWDCGRRGAVLPTSSSDGTIATRERATHNDRESV